MSTQEKINIINSFLENDENYFVSTKHKQDLYNIIYALSLFLENKLSVENRKREIFIFNKDQRSFYLELVKSYLSQSNGDEIDIMVQYFKDELEKEN
jgi:hypothetical protein